MNEMHARTRSNAIDFARGSLVIIMVLYHVLNYFVTDHPLIWDYVFAVGLAFVFFSGLMSGTIYLEKFKRDKRYVFRRLFVSGVKLLVLFFGLNFLIHAMFKENYSGARLGVNLILSRIGPILLRGDPQLMAFEILVPLAYTRWLSMLFLNVAAYGYGTYVVLMCAICALSVLHVPMPYQFLHTLFGLAGICTGFVITKLATKLKNKATTLAVVLILCAYLFVLEPRRGIAVSNMLVFFIFVNVFIAASYLLGGFLESRRLLPRWIVKFGQYSLYLYLAHIFFLQVLYRLGVARTAYKPARILVIFAFINCLLVALYQLTDLARRRISIADKVYRFVFA